MHITMSVKKFQEYIKNEQIYYSYHQTSIGVLTILSTLNGIFKASFDPVEIKKGYQLLTNVNSEKLIIVGTDFQIKVWETTLKIPAGQVTTYQQIAQAIGKPKSYRAIGNALGQNKIAYFIPCHRVLQKSGNLGGYRWGTKNKESLLKKEQNYELL